MRELKYSRKFENNSDVRYYDGYTKSTVPRVRGNQYNPMIVSEREELFNNILDNIDKRQTSPKYDDLFYVEGKNIDVGGGVEYRGMLSHSDDYTKVNILCELLEKKTGKALKSFEKDLVIDYSDFMDSYGIESDIEDYILDELKKYMTSVLAQYDNKYKNENKTMRELKRNLESRGIRRFTESEESNVIYTVKKAWFDSEEDSYEKGVIDSGVSWDINLDLSANSLEDLFKKVQKSLYMSGKGYSWGVELSDMNGETCFLVEYEGDENNDLASDSQIEDWKNGDERLWLVRGRVRVMKAIKPLNVPDEEMEAFARANGLDIL